jgi:signal transduction histidine kinase
MQASAAHHQLSNRPTSGGDTARAYAPTDTVSRRRVPSRRGGWAHGAAISRSIVPLRSLARTTAQACGVHRCSLFAWSEGYLLPVMSQFASGERREHLWRAFVGLGMYRITEIPAFARAVTERRAVIVRDTRDEPGLPRQWAAMFGAASGLVLPLLRDTGIVGVALLDNGAADISREQIRRTRGLGPYLASVIDSALSLSELRGRATVPETPPGGGRTGGAAPDLQDAIRRVTRLYARAAEVALYAERVRVDNVLHDTLRQTLFSIGFRIEAALRGAPRVSAFRAFIRELKQDVGLMMMQINQVIPTGSSPAAPWEELAELEAQIGFGLRDAVGQFPHRVARGADEDGGR